MAPLEQAASRWTAAQTRAQFAAILQLRWRILLNGFRRKGGIGNLVTNILLVPVVAAILLGPSVGAGVAAYAAMARGQFALIQAGLWVIFGISQLANIQFGQPGTTFDPTQLIRFPVSFRSYAAIRMFFGLVSPANLTTLGMSVGAAVGFMLAAPNAVAGILLAMAAFALANIFFTRMLFAWVERWLATRRTREIFTAVILIGSLGIQWANVTFNPGVSSQPCGAGGQRRPAAPRAGAVCGGAAVPRGVAPGADGAGAGGRAGRAPPGRAAADCRYAAVRGGVLYGFCVAPAAGVSGGNALRGRRCEARAEAGGGRARSLTSGANPRLQRLGERPAMP